jgi:hypothetical protein
MPDILIGSSEKELSSFWSAGSFGLRARVCIHQRCTNCQNNQAIKMILPSSVRILANRGAIARRNVEALARKEAMPGGETLRGYCAIASRHLWMMTLTTYIRPTFCAGMFREYDFINGEYKNISGHVWLEVEGHIVDITATQFAGVAGKVKRDFGKKVYVSRDDNPHYLKTHSGEKAFERVRHWHEAPLDSICLGLADYTNELSHKRKRIHYQ